LNLNSIGLNTILEILSYINFLCQSDNCIIEEAKNVFIENAGKQMFTQNHNFQSSQQMSRAEQESALSDSIYLHLLSYWLNMMEDQRNIKYLSDIYIHALNTIKSMLLTSSTFF
jgi:hypothetical protein